MKKYRRIAVITETITMTRVRVVATLDDGTHNKRVVLSQVVQDPMLAARNGMVAAENAADGHRLAHGYKPPIVILGKELDVVG